MATPRQSNVITTSTPSLPRRSPTPADMPRLNPTVVIDGESVVRPGDEEAKQALQKESERQAWFQNEANNSLDIPNGYEKVAVLIIRWDESIDEFEGHDGEIIRLRKLFASRFHFSCEIVKIKNCKKPQLELNFAIYQHVHKYNGPNNLIIIYYTGHGNTIEGPDGGERLELSANLTWQASRGSYVPTALWHKAETPLREEAEADALSILDCCFASSAALKGRSEEFRTYQLLAASAAGSSTNGPGEGSFTTALCDALEELLDECNGGGFPVTKLWERINVRRKTQAALIWDRLERYKRSIQLAPLDPKVERERKKSFRKRDPERASLMMRLSLKVDDLSRKQIEALARQLPEACKEAEIPVRRIDWVKMDVNPETNPVGFAEIMSAKRVVHNYKRRKSNASPTSPVMEKELRVSTRKRTRSGADDGSPSGPSRRRTRSDASTLSPHGEQSMPSPSPSGESLSSVPPSSAE